MKATDKQANALNQIRLDCEFIDFFGLALRKIDVSQEATAHILRLVSLDIWSAWERYDGAEHD